MWAWPISAIKAGTNARTAVCYVEMIVCAILFYVSFWLLFRPGSCIQRLALKSKLKLGRAGTKIVKRARKQKAIVIPLANCNLI